MLGCRIVLNDTFYKVRAPFGALCAMGQLLSTKCELHLAPFAQWDSYFLQSASSNWRPLRNGTATFYKVRAPFGVLCAMGQLLSTKCELHFAPFAHWDSYFLQSASSIWRRMWWRRMPGFYVVVPNSRLQARVRRHSGGVVAGGHDIFRGPAREARRRGVQSGVRARGCVGKDVEASTSLRSGARRRRGL